MDSTLTLAWEVGTGNLVAYDEHGEILRVAIRRDWHSDQKRLFVTGIIKALDTISEIDIRNIEVKE